jgi:hypothetical protein
MDRVGIEPTTLGLKGRYSDQLSYRSKWRRRRDSNPRLRRAKRIMRHGGRQAGALIRLSYASRRANGGNRTHDHRDHRPALCQLSYVRHQLPVWELNPRFRIENPA